MMYGLMYKNIRIEDPQINLKIDKRIILLFLPELFIYILKFISTELSRQLTESTSLINPISFSIAHSIRFASSKKH